MIALANTRSFASVSLLLLFTLSFVAEAAPASNAQIGYIPVESVEQANQISQELLKHEWAKNPIVVPIMP